MLHRLCESIISHAPCQAALLGAPRRAVHAIRTVTPALRSVNELQTGAETPRQAPQGELLDEWIGQPRLQLKKQHIAVGRHELCLIEPADVDAVMDMYIAAGQEDRDPYWARPWPSALALGRYLLDNARHAQGRCVCEVGAGLGIASIAALLAGAERALVTDREPLALECALRSAAASGIAGVATTVQHDGLSKAVHPPLQIEAAILDWSKEYMGPKFDLVLACDVLYEDFSVEHVGRVLPQLLSDNGQMLLADPSERTRHNREYFVDMMLSQHERPLLLEECLAVQENMDGKSHSIEIMRFRIRQGCETVGVKTLRKH